MDTMRRVGWSSLYFRRDETGLGSLSHTSHLRVRRVCLIAMSAVVCPSYYFTTRDMNGALMNALGNDIPIYIPKVKHQILRFIIDRTLKDLHHICPRLVRRVSPPKKTGNLAVNSKRIQPEINNQH